MSSFSDDPLIDDAPVSDTDIQGVVDVGGVKRGDNMGCLVKGILRAIGEDPTREGLAKTPFRVNEALKWLTKGYNETVENVVNDAVFSTDNDDIVLVRDIDIYSLCEHHMLPFFGKAHIAYIPDGKIIGISKLPRIAEVFARRLQVQEQLTYQIAKGVEQAVNARGVAVVLECTHLCMVMRGIQKTGTTTVTRTLLGAFKEEVHLRSEFLKLINGETV